jgi:hypothetical protein
MAPPRPSARRWAALAAAVLLLGAAAGQQSSDKAGGSECDTKSAPGAATSVRANVLNDTAVEASAGWGGGHRAGPRAPPAAVGPGRGGGRRRRAPPARHLPARAPSHARRRPPPAAARRAVASRLRPTHRGAGPTTHRPPPPPPTTPHPPTHPLPLSRARQVVWLPPGGGGCFNSFTVSGKDAKGGAALPAQTVDSGLTATFANLKPGATYEFTVTASGPAGKASAAPASAALPPAFLNVRPDAPTGLRVVALDDSSAKVAWGLPPGNPKVDTYEITAVPVNATGCVCARARARIDRPPRAAPLHALAKRPAPFSKPCRRPPPLAKCAPIHPSPHQPTITPQLPHQGRQEHHRVRWGHRRLGHRQGPRPEELLRLFRIR